ncbi:MAG: TolC family protein [Oxalobacter sp.]|nr:TolC family protein [Oxalobacter sp.]
MRQKRLIPAILLCAVLAGCATKTAEIPDHGLISQQAIAEQYQVDREWWKIYGDHKLNLLVNEALANNIDLRKSAINVNKALYQANLLGEDLIPSFYGSAGASANKDLKEGRTTHNYNAQLGVSYEIDLWHRLRDAASAQEWEYKATQLDLESARLALINNVVDSYFHLVYLNNAIKITRQNIDFYSRLLTIVRNKHQVGKVDISEPLNANKSLLSSQNSLKNLESERKQVEQTLRNLLNLRPEDPLSVLNDDLMGVPLTDVDLNVPVAALGMRPDVKAAEFRVQSAFLDWEAAKGDLYPSITIGSTLGVSSNRARTMFNAPMLGGTVNLNLPFLQWNRLRWNIRMSEAEFESAKLGLTSAINTALNEVDTYYYTYQRTRSQLGIQQDKYSNDVRISQYNRRRYEVGSYELKEWLEAKCAENQSLMTLLETKYRAINEENAIYKALGARIVTAP